MATESADFKAAAEDIKKLTTAPDNNEMLKLYGLYKQGTTGDCNTDRPGMFDLKGKAKWDAWNGNKGVSSEDAQAQYVAFVGELKTKYGTA